MFCPECSSFIIPKKGEIVLKNDVLGEYTVKNVEYYMCETCNECYYPSETLKKIEAQEAQVKENLLLERPLRDFIHAGEVADMLKCSRQAVHKNKRIRRGFIHWVRHGGKICYLRQSAAMFKKIGDGRIPLTQKEWGIVKQFGPLSKFRKKTTQQSFDSGGKYIERPALSVSKSQE